MARVRSRDPARAPSAMARYSTITGSCEAIRIPFKLERIKVSTRMAVSEAAAYNDSLAFPLRVLFKTR